MHINYVCLALQFYYKLLAMWRQNNDGISFILSIFCCRSTRTFIVNVMKSWDQIKFKKTCLTRTLQHFTPWVGQIKYKNRQTDWLTDRMSLDLSTTRFDLRRIKQRCSGEVVLNFNLLSFTIPLLLNFKSPAVIQSRQFDCSESFLRHSVDNKWDRYAPCFATDKK